MVPYRDLLVDTVLDHSLVHPLVPPAQYEQPPGVCRKLLCHGLVKGFPLRGDERVVEHCIDEEVSVGDYVLTGGELPALVIIDASVRLLPGVLG
ncbi:MAG TPA: hypothetical protein ENI12_01105, partial [Nitrospirae bacterium]|nr:hypothetical protein [Nitrospirota bacterium]